LAYAEKFCRQAKGRGPVLISFNAKAK